MELRDLILHKNKNILICVLMFISFFLLFPSVIKIINLQYSPFTEREVVITTLSYKSEGIDNNQPILTVGSLFQPSPKFSNKSYPAIILCHGEYFDIGKEMLNHWAVELAKRGFVILSIDLPGNGMSLGEHDIFPRKDLEPRIIQDGIEYLKSLKFVKSESIGILGYETGGNAALLSAGITPKLINATISINGMTNVTRWLIDNKLPNNNITFTVSQEFISLKSINGIKITPKNIQTLLESYELVNAELVLVRDLIVKDTTKLNRTHLKKYNALDSLTNVRNDSVLFLESQIKTPFNSTLQLHLAKNKLEQSSKNAVYLSFPPQSEVLFNSDQRILYSIINFFEEKLYGVDLGFQEKNDFEKYTQRRDIELHYISSFDPSLVIELGIVFTCSFIPFFLILVLIFKNKEIVNDRAERAKEFLNRRNEVLEVQNYSFWRGSYKRLGLYSFLLIFTFSVSIIGISLGYFTDLIVGTLIVIYYLLFFLILYYFPDKAEVELRRERKGVKSIHSEKFFEYLKKVRAIIPLILMGILILLPIVWGFLNYMAFQTFHSLKFLGDALFGIGGIIFSVFIIICTFEVKYWMLADKLKTNESENLEPPKIKYNGLENLQYNVLKSLIIGSLTILCIIFQWNVITHFLKFPFILAPNSPSYLYLLFLFIVIYGISAGLPWLLKHFYLDGKLGAIFLKFKASSYKTKLKNLLSHAVVYITGIMIFSILFLFPFFFFFNNALTRTFSISFCIFFFILYNVGFFMRIFFSNKKIYGIDFYTVFLILSIILAFFHI